MKAIIVDNDSHISTRKARKLEHTTSHQYIVYAFHNIFSVIVCCVPLFYAPGVLAQTTQESSALPVVSPYDRVTAYGYLLVALITAIGAIVVPIALNASKNARSARKTAEGAAELALNELRIRLMSAPPGEKFGLFEDCLHTIVLRDPEASGRILNDLLFALHIRPDILEKYQSELSTLPNTASPSRDESEEEERLKRALRKLIMEQHDDC